MLRADPVPFHLNALARPKLWERFKATPAPDDVPDRPTLERVVKWFGEKGVPARFDASVRPAYRTDPVTLEGETLLELLEAVHNGSRGSRVRFEADGTVVIESNLTARRAWFAWWEQQNP